MSAFIVNQNHINALVNYAIENNLYLPNFLDKTGNCKKITSENAQKVVNILIRENCISVNYRYNENNFLKYKFVEKKNKYSHAQIIQFVDCLDYQSCEHPKWERSLACAILMKIKNCAYSNIVKLPENLEWEAI